MKKSLFITLFGLASIAAKCQFTMLKANKSLQTTFVQFNGKAFLTSQLDSTLWLTDGTPTGTIQLSTTIRVSDKGAPLNGNFIFVGKTAATGWELYISDGTVSGTHVLKDINNGSQSSNPDDFALFNGKLYFSAQNTEKGRELWKTDGTDAGTSIVKDIIGGAGSSNAAGKYNLFSSGSYLLFTATIPGKGVELFKSDGTEGGTDMLKDINPGAASSNADNFTSYNNAVLFVATTADNGEELWRTDGTLLGTTLVKDILDGAESGMTSTYYFPFNDKLLFTANNGINGEELWITDGTGPNTHMVKDINAGEAGSNVFLFSVIKIGNRIIFAADDSTISPFPGMTYSSNRELWESDGTEAGTKLFKEIVDGVDGSFPSLFIQYNPSSGSFNASLFQGNKFFFNAVTPDAGSELWISDGTANGTHMVKDIGPGDNNGITMPYYVITKDVIYFAADDNVHGNEIWKSDGTLDGTAMIADINPNSDPTRSSSDMQLPFFLNDKIIFAAKNTNGAIYSLYRLDGAFAPLPVTLSEFTVTPKNADALLSWNTLTEVNTKDFTVQRSDDGVRFETIGTVEASGNSTEKQTYRFTDAAVGNSAREVVYYRLMMNDRDGKFTYSKTISIKLKGIADWAVKLVKNPVISEINLSTTGVTEPVKVSVRDISGRPVNIKATISSNGLTNLSTANMTPGVYILLAETSKGQKVIKFVKQ